MDVSRRRNTRAVGVRYEATGLWLLRITPNTKHQERAVDVGEGLHFVVLCRLLHILWSRPPAPVHQHRYEDDVK